MSQFADYWIGVGDAFSKLVNSFIPGRKINESLSARAFRQHEESAVWKLVYDTVNTLFFRQENHCRKVFEDDQRRNRAALAEGAQTCLEKSGIG